MRILLVEDDAVLRAVVRRSLADAGHRVDVAASVTEARRSTGPLTMRRRPARWAPQPSASPMSSASVRM